MTVCKKPCTIYDVDLAGLVGVVALAVTAWWFVGVPGHQAWARAHELALQRTASQAGLRAHVAELEQFERQLTQLEQIVASQAGQIPHPESLSDLLRRMTELAKNAHLELINVVPRPATTDGAYWTCDIEVTGRGQSLDFVRFLDELARANPYQALQHCTLIRSGDETQSVCDLSWTVRFYAFPTVAAKSGGRP